MIIPIVLLLFATLAAGLMAYGTHAGWAQYSSGIDFILFARRIQWPMAVLSLLLCLSVLGLVVSGKRRAWWLIGLAPIVALFAHRFIAHPSNHLHVIESPAFVDAAQAKFIADSDYVVGLRFGDHDYAYPYAALFETPVVIHAEHDQRVIVMWSAYANRARAFSIGRDLRGSDVEVVSTPANALMLYNGRLGEFINALTGETPKGAKPSGFRDAVATSKCTWKDWRARHPETKVLVPVGDDYATAPRGPLKPAFPMPMKRGQAATNARVTVIESASPIAVQSAFVGTAPLNLTAGNVPVLMFRHPQDGTPRAFRRELDDMRPRFRANIDTRKRPTVAFIDEDTGAGWDPGGVAVDGPKEYRGKKLPPLPVDDDLSEDVMRFWYPNLKRVEPQQAQTQPVRRGS